MTAIEDGIGDVGGEIGQSQDPGKVGSVQLLAPGELGEFAAVRLQQLRFEQMRPDDQLYQARVRSGRELVAPLDPQRHLFACTTKLRGDGEDQELGVRFIWALGNG